MLNQTSGIETYQAFGNLKSTDSYGKHVYANANYGLLGLIIEEVSGISYEEYVTEYIFKPLGMPHATAVLIVVGGIKLFLICKTDRKKCTFEIAKKSGN